jgi:hypothetical protein
MAADTQHSAGARAWRGWGRPNYDITTATRTGRKRSVQDSVKDGATPLPTPSIAVVFYIDGP